MQITIIIAALLSAVALASGKSSPVPSFRPGSLHAPVMADKLSTAIPDANAEATPKGKRCHWTPCAAIAPECPPHFTRETTAKCADGTTGAALCCRA
jgi:hypothetical protein